mmetsp:Transcript_34687/g.50811  ORF Transcript_34687/g.50811 Transcript_34687/m.50811 type:complete len:761 (+) Transcript_34687:273-2555(+)
MRAVQRQMRTFRLRVDKPLPPSIDCFGWCTWDAFYSQVDGPGIVKGLSTLRDGGVPATFLVIDDGWQDTSDKAPPELIKQRTPTEDFTAPESSPQQGPTNTLQLPQPSLQLPQLQATRALKHPEKIITRISKSLSQCFGAAAHCMGTHLLGALGGYYEGFVASAAHTSWHIWLWRLLSSTVLKSAILADYEQKYDFCKRLQSLHAGDRFLDTLEDRSFPKLISKLKSEHGVSLVYCWHALHGYWSGVHKGVCGEGEDDLEISIVTPTPNAGALQIEPRMSWDALVLKGVGLSSRAKMDTFYQELHSYLKKSKVDGVKVDVQGAASMMGTGRGGSAVATRDMIHAMERSVQHNFGAQNCINCMCHPIECLYAYNETNVARASEDFFPGDPASHSLHVANVAFNSLFIGEIAFPDWDMFQSSHSLATLHAVARAVGGCGVYVSDHPGKHNLDLLRRLVLPDGSVLRALNHGRPTRDSLFKDVSRDGRSACKIWNRNPCGGGIVAAMNVQGYHWNRVHRRQLPNGGKGYTEPRVTASVAPADFEPTDFQTPLPLPHLQPSTQDTDMQAVHCADATATAATATASATTATASTTTAIATTSSIARWAVLMTHWGADGRQLSNVTYLSLLRHSREVELAAKECAVFTFAQVRRAGKAGAEVEWAVLGLERLFNGGGALLEASAGEERIELQVRGQGSLLVYMSRKPLQVLLDQVPLADDDIVYNQSQALLRLQIPALGEGGHQEAGKGEETTGRKTRTRKITILV